IKINKEGMNLTAIDPANVAMAYFSIPADLFSEFVVEKDEVLGVNLENLNSIMRRCKMGSSLIIEREDSSIKIIINDKIKREFSLALMDVEGDEKQMPAWEFKSVIKLDAQSFVDAIEDCAVVADACTFIAQPDKFIIESSNLHSARTEFSSDEAQIFSDNSSARFSLDYLSKFVKGAKIANRVEINFSDNHPMRLNFPSGKVMLSFVLAPRVEQDN
ncbi:MAG TPA: hypothetical protein VJH20_00575, partial [Candidatus Nanoarchaeia archaeon]|nr:hypothetical protein [Candidatus Nanoarchaeia archaeon]